MVGELLAVNMQKSQVSSYSHVSLIVSPWSETFAPKMTSLLGKARQKRTKRMSLCCINE